MKHLRTIYRSIIGKAAFMMSLFVFVILVILSGCASYSFSEKMKKGDYDGAIQESTKQIQNTSATSDPVIKASYYSDRAWAKSKKGDAEGAKKDIQQAKRLISQGYEESHVKLALVSKVLLKSGRINKRNGEYEDAMKDYKKALQVAPDETHLADVTMHQGDLQKKMGNLDEAIQDYNQSIDLATETSTNVSEDIRAMAHKRRGDAKHAKGNYDSSIKDWKKALEIDASEWNEAERNKIKEKIQTAKEKTI